MRRREITKRTAVVMLAVSMVFTSLGLDGMRTDAGSAENTVVNADPGDSEVITLFAALPEDIRTQNLAPGAGESDIQLPDKLTARVSTLCRPDSSTTGESTAVSDNNSDPAADGKTEEVTVNDVTINDVTWKLDSAKSDHALFESDEADCGSVYVYEPVLPDGYMIADGVSLPEVKVQITDGTGAFVKSVYVDGVKITVMAEEGVFPQNADVKASKVTSEAQNEKIEAAVNDEADQLITYDISVQDENGNEVEPDNSRGKVKVIFGKPEETVSDRSDIHVFHMDDADSRPEELDASVDSSDGSVSVETQHFSLFTLVLRSAGIQNTVNKDTVTIMNDPSKVYDGTAVEDPSVRTNGGGTVTFSYYQGTDTTGTALGSAPQNAGSYTVVAHEAATANYAVSDSDPKIFTIAPRKLILDLSGSRSGDGITVTAAIFGGGNPSGQVSFTVNAADDKQTYSNSVTVTAQGNLYCASFSARCADLSPSTGSFTVHAQYTDDSGNYQCEPASATYAASSETRTITGVNNISATYGDGDKILNPGTESSKQNDTYSYEVVYDSFNSVNSSLGPAVSVTHSTADNTATVSIMEAGTSVIKITLHDGGSHYDDACAYVTVTVAPKALAVTSTVTDSAGKTVTSVPYGQAGSLKYGLTYNDTAFTKGDTSATYTKGYGFLSPVGLTNTTAAGTYNVEIVKSDNFLSRNYQLQYTKAALTVTPAVPTLTVPSQALMIGWGSSFLPGTAEADGVNIETISGDLVWSETQGGSPLGNSWKAEGTAGGTKKLYWTFTPVNKNYTTTTGSKDFTLADKNPTSIELTADKESGVTYGDSIAYTATLKNTSGAVKKMSGNLKLYLGDSSTGELLGQTTDASPVRVTVGKSKLIPGSHTVTAVYEGCDYYQPATADRTVNVAKKVITAAADDLTMTAGGVLPVFTVSYSGIVSGEKAADLLKTQAAASCAADGKTAGKYPITVTAPVLTASAEELYTLGTSVNGTLTVQPAPQNTSNDHGSSNTQNNQPAAEPAQEPVKEQAQNTEQRQPAGGEQNTGSNPDGKKTGKNHSDADQGNTEAAGPVIKGDSGIAGWDAIKTQIDHAGSGKTITVEMNGTGTVPGEVLSSIKGRDVTLTIDMGSGISWSIDGKNVTSDSIPDIDFTVNKGADEIPADVINQVTGERYSMNISIAYSGKFGFQATLSVNMGAKNKGLYANLFYFNQDTKALEFMTYGKIAADGTAKLDFTHASDYTIVIDGKPMDGSMTASDKSAVKQQTGSAETAESTEPAQNSSQMTPTDVVVLVCVILILCFAAGYFIYIRKKDSGDDEE